MSLESVGILLIAAGVTANIVMLVIAARAAVEGKQTRRIRNLVFASFGVIVAGVGLLAFATELLVGRIVGLALLATAAVAIRQPSLSNRRKNRAP